MSTDGPRSFSAIEAEERAKLHAEFISYREALTKLAEFTGESIKQIAAFLLNSPVILERRVAIHEIAIGHAEDIRQLLLRSSAIGKIEPVRLSPALLRGVAQCEPKPALLISSGNQTIEQERESRPLVRGVTKGRTIDPDRVGWRRGGFIYMLRQAGWPCPDSLLPPEGHAVDIAPKMKWAQSDVIAGLQAAKMRAHTCVPAGSFVEPGGRNRLPEVIGHDRLRQATPDLATGKRTVTSRSNPLKSIIQKAKEKAVDGGDVHSVWGALVLLAQDQNPPAPLIGYADSEGVKWNDSGVVKFLTKKNLGERLRRAKAR